MQQLTNAEEQLMEHLWKLEKAFMKDLLEHFQNQNQDHYRATLLKRMIDKDFVAYTEVTPENPPKQPISQNTSTD
jgi:predicted transcriptional regulator